MKVSVAPWQPHNGPVIDHPRFIRWGLMRCLIGLIVLLGVATATNAQTMPPTGTGTMAPSVQALIDQLKQATSDSQAQIMAYQQRQEQVHERVLTQEQRNTQEQRDVDRLDQLIKKYSGGERMAQRLQTTFTRLGRERLRYNNRQVLDWEAELQTLTETTSISMISSICSTDRPHPKSRP